MPRALLTALALLSLAGCDHPIPVVSSHVEAADVLLADRPTGTLLARTRDNRTWEGALPAVASGATLALASQFVDFRGAAIDLSGRADFRVRIETEDPRAAVFEPLVGFGRLTALQPGAARVRVVLWHVDHADFVSPWLPWSVRPGPP